MLISRADRGLVARWWFTVDRPLMFAVFLLMAIGVLFSLAASPPVAERIGLPYFHFFNRQLIFLIPSVIILAGLSFLDPGQARRVSMWVFVGSLGLMVLALFFGPEIKGAHRWLDLGPINLQPSEIAKPSFIVVSAWFLAEGRRHKEMPGQIFAWACYGGFTGLLLLQPDFGQTVLVGLVWAALLLVYGIPWLVIIVLAGLGAGGAVAAYFALPHVAQRVDRFIHPENSDTFQVDLATRAFENGGLLGTGPGGGQAKMSLPDAHTDFIFAVIGEEFGLIACIVLIALVAFVSLRVLRYAMSEGDSFVVLALTGLVSLFSFQAIINMGVNVSLLPAKGMTLPFISYGGSSMMSMALAMGLVLSLTRRRPKVYTATPSSIAAVAG